MRILEVHVTNTINAHVIGHNINIRHPPRGKGVKTKALCFEGGVAVAQMY